MYPNRPLNTHNAYVFYAKGDQNVALVGIPAATEATPYPTVTLDDTIRYLGRCKSDGGFDIEAKTDGKDTRSNDVTSAFDLKINVEMLVKMRPTIEQDLDGSDIQLIFINDDAGLDVPDNAEMLSEALNLSNTTLSDEGNYVLAPTRLTISPGKKFGSGNISTIKIAGSKLVPSRARGVREVNLQI